MLRDYYYKYILVYSSYDIFQEFKRLCTDLWGM